MKIKEQIVDSDDIIHRVLVKAFPDEPTWDIEPYDEYCTLIEETLLCLVEEVS